MANKKIEMNVSNKLFYSVLSLIVVVVLGVGVYAYGGTAPATMGHTVGELMPSCTGWLRGISNDPNSWSCTSIPPSCTGTNQALHWNGASWSCVTIDCGGYDCYWSGWYPTSSYDYCYYDYRGCSLILTSSPLGENEIDNLDLNTNTKLDYEDLAYPLCPEECYYPYAAQTEFLTQDYCSYGYITNTRTAMRCPMPSTGSCPSSMTW